MISDHTPLPWNGAAWSFIQNGIYKLTDMGFLFAYNTAAISGKIKSQNQL